MSDRSTPETDAAEYYIRQEGHYVRSAFARKLERERNEAREERDILVQKLDAWQEIAEHLHHFVQHPAYGVEQAIKRMDVLAAYKHLNNEH